MLKPDPWERVKSTRPQGPWSLRLNDEIAGFDNVIASLVVKAAARLFDVVGEQAYLRGAAYGDVWYWNPLAERSRMGESDRRIKIDD